MHKTISPLRRNQVQAAVLYTRNADDPVYLVANLMPSGVGSENASSSLATGYPIRKSPLQEITVHLKITTQFSQMQLLNSGLEIKSFTYLHFRKFKKYIGIFLLENKIFNKCNMINTLLCLKKNYTNIAHQL